MIENRLKQLNEYDANLSIEDSRKRLKKFKRTRNIILWHDASSLANHGHLVFMVHTLFDPPIHLTNEEYKAKTGKNSKCPRNH